MAKKANEIDWAEVRRLAMAETAAALREGRHSRTFITVCEGCRQWTESIMHVQLDGKRVCLSCAVAQGAIKLEESS